MVANLASKSNAPFVCPECGEEVLLKTGTRNVRHFAHINPLACIYSQNESETHRQCKLEIFDSLQRTPGVTDALLERSLMSVRPDVSANINGVPVAIEVQISSLSLETITHRTIEYARKGIYVLWLLQWMPELDQRNYAPRLWEKWIHAAYFGRVYYWTGGLSVVRYRFEPHLISVPKATWYSERGKKMTGGGFTRRSKRHRTAVRGDTLNLATDFAPKSRDWWERNGLFVPFAKLFMEPTDTR